MARFCERCGSAFRQDTVNPQVCEAGHQHFDNPIVTVDSVFFNTEGEVLVAKRAIDPWKGQYDLVGGFVEVGETLEQCFEREAKEETGLERTDYGEVLYVSSGPVTYPYKGTDKQLIIPAFVTQLKPNARPKARDDVAALAFYPLADIDSLLFCNPEYPKIIRKAYTVLNATMLS